MFGSVARGDFNAHSDIDLLIVVDTAPTDHWTRLRCLGDLPADVEPVVWTSSEWRRRRDRGDPITVDAETAGVSGSSAIRTPPEGPEGDDRCATSCGCAVVADRHGAVMLVRLVDVFVHQPRQAGAG